MLQNAVIWECYITREIEIEFKAGLYFLTILFLLHGVCSVYGVRIIPYFLFVVPNAE